MSLFNLCNEESCGTLEYTRIENEMIVGFNLWGEKRLCLPQLLRFVLNDFDLDVIDRAVTDLRIKCFQCSSEQVEMLSETNIFPSKIHKCGLIRKSDAERLCKYLLQPNLANSSMNNFHDDLNQLPSIEVIHMCFGEQSGTFYPILYISADAKCIKCSTCDNLFRTYEFVGHTHKLDEVSNTSHWGFDSTNWRLLIHLNKQKSDANTLNRSRSILDSVKMLFYEKELNKNGKFVKTVLWRPRKKINLPPPPQIMNRNILPPHLLKNQVEVYRKGPGNVRIPHNQHCASRLQNTNILFPPNIYLKEAPGSVHSNSELEDDDFVGEDATTNQLVGISKGGGGGGASSQTGTMSANETALNTALQIKKDLLPRDFLTLGCLNFFMNQQQQSSPGISSSTSNSTNIPPHPPPQLASNSHSHNSTTSNINGSSTTTTTATNNDRSNVAGLVVASQSSSIPAQYLMVEAVWSTLIRDIVQLVSYSVPTDERNRVLSQMFRCQDVLKSYWTTIVEENSKLIDSMKIEKQHSKELECMHDKLVTQINELRRDRDQWRDKASRVERQKEQSRHLLLETVAGGGVNNIGVKNRDDYDSRIKSVAPKRRFKSSSNQNLSHPILPTNHNLSESRHPSPLATSSSTDSVENHEDPNNDDSSSLQPTPTDQQLHHYTAPFKFSKKSRFHISTTPTSNDPHHNPILISKNKNIDTKTTSTSLFHNSNNNNNNNNLGI